MMKIEKVKKEILKRTIGKKTHLIFFKYVWWGLQEGQYKDYHWKNIEWHKTIGRNLKKASLEAK